MNLYRAFSNYKKQIMTQCDINVVLKKQIMTQCDINVVLGFGIEVSPDGTRYEGEWREGMRSGRGTLFVKRNSRECKIYTGDWEFHKKHVYKYLFIM